MRSMTRGRLIILVTVTAVAILVGGAMVYYRATFPYGESHCCIIAMSFALEKYAEEDGGRYPA